ncbi:N-acetyltransferase family protein [Micromonospora globispora]|uniref:GNAT family N-acetyltransferase n=1 Tax=Micromonospora globispora TaxID=1450148 RepID=UPI0026C8A356
MPIRPARPEDAPAVVALRALVYPYLVRGVEGTRQMIATTPRSRLVAVAEVDGAVAGWVSTYTPGGGSGGSPIRRRSAALAA